jgi:hypothetical protein
MLASGSTAQTKEIKAELASWWLSFVTRNASVPFSGHQGWAGFVATCPRPLLGLIDALRYFSFIEPNAQINPISARQNRVALGWREGGGYTLPALV